MKKGGLLMLSGFYTGRRPTDFDTRPEPGPEARAEMEGTTDILA